MKKSEAFPDRSSYISKEDVDTPRIGTIFSISHKTFEEDGGEKRKPVFSFVEEDLKPFICNPTNWDLIEYLYPGDDSNVWIGKKIELWHDPTVMNKGKRVGGVRVRKPSAAAQQAAPASPPFANFAAATAYALEHGVTTEAFKAYLKLQGLTAFSASRDSELVYRFVETEITGREAEPIE